MRVPTLVSLVLVGCIPKIDGVDAGTDPTDVVVGDDGTDGTGSTDGTDPDPDSDGDGSPASEDCDDDDPNTNPDAEEVFDETDNDCDGWVDEVEICEEGYATVQDAVDDVPDGATLLLCAGTYEETLDLGDRTLTLGSEDGAEATVISGSDSGVPLSVGDGGDVTVVGIALANGAGEDGGGASCSRGTLHFIDAIVRDSTATRGGGIYAENCELIVETSTVENNVAAEQGGGVFATRCSGNLLESTFQTNLGVEGGGGFLFEGSIEVEGSAFVSNEATTTDESTWGSGSGGGGLWTSSTGSVVGARIAENHSGYNGGGVYFYRGRPELDGSVVEDNTCDEDGAGAYFNVSQGRVTNNEFLRNEAADDAGGLRFFYGSSVVDGNLFVGNAAGDDGGGAKFSHSEHQFRNNIMEDNRTGDAGGGLELDNDSTHVESSVFRNNQAYRGAGVHNWRTEATFTIETSTFEGNEASDCGGGISFDNSPYRITLSQLTFVDNRASDGAGICVDRIYRDPEDVGGVENFFENTILRIVNTALYDNEAADDGGGMYVRAGEVDVINTVFDSNAGPDGGGMSVKGSAVSLVNTIVASNDGPALWVEDTDDGPGSIDVSYSDIWDNDSVAVGMDSPVGSDGNIAEDPRYSGSGDFVLPSSSACVDAGDPSITDQDGSRSDMGLYGGPGAP